MGVSHVWRKVHTWITRSQTLFSLVRCYGYFFFSLLIFVPLLFEGSVCFFGKLTDINNDWIGYVQAIQWWLLDAVNSMHSLSVLLPAVETSHTTQIVLALASWPLSEINCICVHAMCILATATIHGWHLFCSEFPIVRLPIGSGNYSSVASIQKYSWSI